MTADRIADTIDLIKKGFVDPGIDELKIFKLVYEMFCDVETVVDATGIYQNLDAMTQSFDPYEKYSCIAPPWEAAIIGFINRHGNVLLIELSTHLNDGRSIIKQIQEVWKTDNPLNWNEVKWITLGYVWMGGRSTTRNAFIKPIGPCHIIQFAIAEDGRPLDIHWVQIRSDIPKEVWDTSEHVVLQSLNFMNCRNVELAEPKRSRPQRRRIERTGLRINEINVRPIRKSYGPREKGSSDSSVPAHSVRGHFAHYGPQWGTGKLFGKLEGRFYIPQHARGSREHGEVQHRYKLRPGGLNEQSTIERSTGEEG